MATTFTPLATTTVSSTVSSITFSGISQSYTDLVAICTPIFDNSGNMFVYYNSVTSTSYASHRIFITSSATASWTGSETGLQLGNFISGQPGMCIANFMNYRNTNIRRTSLSQYGSHDASTPRYGSVSARSANTEAITSLTFFSSAGNFLADTVITLYGIAQS